MDPLQQNEDNDESAAKKEADESDAKNVPSEFNEPSRSRANFEPQPLDMGYESHPFFNRFHKHLQTNSVYDIWRPTTEEFQNLQKNNSFDCLSPTIYPTGTGISRLPTTFPSAAEQAWHSSGSAKHSSELTSGTPSTLALPPQLTTFSSAAEQAWYSVSSTRPDPFTPSSATYPPPRPTTFSSAAEQAWYSAEAFLSTESRAESSSSSHPRPTTLSVAAEQTWHSTSQNRPIDSTSATPSSSTTGTSALPRPTSFSSAAERALLASSSSIRPTTFETQISSPAPSNPFASSFPSQTFNNFQQHQQFRGNFHSSTSLSSAMFPRHISPSSSLPSSPRSQFPRVRGRRSRPQRNAPSTSDQPGPSTSRKR
uniref:Uncharacterized protein n=1 Tax=Panagrolaimus davidi TaxID=227884 RepID=A0A914Q9G9_9BILA